MELTQNLPLTENQAADETIAVIIPVYNGADYVGQAIESVLRQTFPATEIVVVDDGSSDNTAEVARSYPGVKVITQPNAGVSASRNNGVKNTTAHWLAFLDHDDLWDVDKLENQIQAIRKEPTADACFIGRRTLTQVGTTDQFELEVGGYPMPPSSAVPRMLYGRLRFVPSATMVRRSVFLKVGGFESAAQPSEDWDLCLRMVQAGAHLITCPQLSLFYRIHTSNSSNNGKRMYLAETWVYDHRIAPRIHPILRPFYRARAQSGFLAGWARVDREQKLPHLGIMLRSLAIFPFGNWVRYRIAAHMLLKNAGILR
jgi:glycosyltransferase involved in cell wall biosynthesis